MKKISIIMFSSLYIVLSVIKGFTGVLNDGSLKLFIKAEPTWHIGINRIPDFKNYWYLISKSNHMINPPPADWYWTGKYTVLISDFQNQSLYFGLNKIWGWMTISVLLIGISFIIINLIKVFIKGWLIANEKK